MKQIWEQILAITPIITTVKKEAGEKEAALLLHIKLLRLLGIKYKSLLQLLPLLPDRACEET